MTSGRYHRNNAARGPIIASAPNVPITTGRFHPDTAAFAAVRACGRCSAAMLIMPRRGLLAAAIGLFASGSVVRSSTAADDEGAFPADFVWGASTSNYQIEGAVDEDGRGKSIWDVFSHTPGRVKNGDTGDIACDHYHRWRDDIDLLARGNFSAYRFSTAWSRILPSGGGAVEQRGLDFYDRLVDGLIANGVAPWLCLYHWDLPQALQEKGGWLNRDTSATFADYARVVARRPRQALGDLQRAQCPRVVRTRYGRARARPEGLAQHARRHPSPQPGARPRRSSAACGARGPAPGHGDLVAAGAAVLGHRRRSPRGRTLRRHVERRLPRSADDRRLSRPGRGRFCCARRRRRFAHDATADRLPWRQLLRADVRHARTAKPLRRMVRRGSGRHALHGDGLADRCGRAHRRADPPARPLRQSGSLRDRERRLLRRSAGGGRHRTRRRSHRLSARAPRRRPPRARRRCKAARLFRLVAARQLRMGGRLQPPLRRGSRRFQDAQAHAQGVLSMARAVRKKSNAQKVICRIQDVVARYCDSTEFNAARIALGLRLHPV